MNFKYFLAGFCCKGHSSAYRVKSQKKKIFPYGSNLPFALRTGNLALTKNSLKLLPFRNPDTGTLGNTSSSSLLGVNTICSSSVIVLTF